MSGCITKNICVFGSEVLSAINSNASLSYTYLDICCKLVSYLFLNFWFQYLFFSSSICVNIPAFIMLSASSSTFSASVELSLFSIINAGAHACSPVKKLNSPYLFCPDASISSFHLSSTSFEMAYFTMYLSLSSG